MLTFWVYILRVRTGHYYVGHTNDLERRLSEHAMGQGDGFVANRLPFELLHCKTFEDRDQAFRFERRLKGWSRAKKEAFMKQRWGDLSVLALPPKERAARLTARRWAGDRASLDCARDDEIQGSYSTIATSKRNRPSDPYHPERS
ncbi:MAG: GIY-YIG nuclease family protein, partial [Pseudomonadota bacterium]